MFLSLLSGPGFAPSPAPIEPVDHTLLGLPPLVVIGGGILAFLILAGFVGSLLRKAGTKVIAQRLDADLAATGVPEPELRRQAMADPEWFAPVQSLLRGEAVLGLAEVGFPRSASDDTLRSVFNSLGPLLGARLVDRDLGSYVAVTPTALHYALFDAGQLREHQVWSRASLGECSLRTEYDTSERRLETVEYTHVLRLVHGGQAFELPVASTISRSPQRRTILAHHAPAVAPRLHALVRGFFATLDARGGAA